MTREGWKGRIAKCVVGWADDPERFAKGVECEIASLTEENESKTTEWELESVHYSTAWVKGEDVKLSALLIFLGRSKDLNDVE